MGGGCRDGIPEPAWEHDRLRCDGGREANNNKNTRGISWRWRILFVVVCAYSYQYLDLCVVSDGERAGGIVRKERTVTPKKDAVFVPTMVTQGYSIPFYSLCTSAPRLFFLVPNDRRRNITDIAFLVMIEQGMYYPGVRDKFVISKHSSYPFSKFTRASIYTLRILCEVRTRTNERFEIHVILYQSIGKRKPNAEVWASLCRKLVPACIHST